MIYEMIFVVAYLIFILPLCLLVVRPPLLTKKHIKNEHTPTIYWTNHEGYLAVDEFGKIVAEIIYDKSDKRYTFKFLSCDEYIDVESAKRAVEKRIKSSRINK